MRSRSPAIIATVKRSLVVLAIGLGAGVLALALGLSNWGALLAGLGAFFAVKWAGLLPR